MNDLTWASQEEFEAWVRARKEECEERAAIIEESTDCSRYEAELQAWELVWRPYLTAFH
jgi:hypothetical protein